VRKSPTKSFQAFPVEQESCTYLVKVKEKDHGFEQIEAILATMEDSYSGENEPED